MENDLSIIKKLLVELNIFINNRYGKVSKIILSILLLRFFLLYSSKVLLFYLDEIDLNEIDLNEKEKISDNKKDGKLKNIKIKLKKILSFRGGSLEKILQLLPMLRDGATFVEVNLTILSIFPFLLKMIRPEDFALSVYNGVHDLYLARGTLKGMPIDSCIDGNRGFSYLLLIFDDPTDSIPFEKKKEEIYRVIFEKGNLASSNKKGEFFMRIFLTCAIIFLLFFRDKGGHGPTILAFFEALMEAVKNKKISKSLVRSLVRRLRKNGIPVPPELEDLVAN